MRPVALQQIWHALGLDPQALARLSLTADPIALPSSFRVADAAQTSIAAAALAASCIFELRTGKQLDVHVSRLAAEMECTGLFRLDGQTPDMWAKFSGLYPTADGHVRVHANFDHHRDGVLRLLKLPKHTNLVREDVEQALLDWNAEDFESAAADRNLVVTKARSFAAWDQHPQALAVAGQPLITLTRLDDADVPPLPAIDGSARPLTGIRVLDLTRILAGPVCGRTLAAYGADVMLVNSPHLPNIASIIETSRGKRSVHLDLTTATDIEQLKQLSAAAHIFVQGYRPGGLDALGFDAASLAALKPGIICVNLSAYGRTGPWATRRGFDSLVQTATGFNHAEAEALGAADPKALPVQILDYASGFFMACGAQAALLKHAEQGGSWQVDVSLLQTANWLRSLGRNFDDLQARPDKLTRYLQAYPCGAGELMAMPHAATFDKTAVTWTRPANLPGADLPQW